MNTQTAEDDIQEGNDVYAAAAAAGSIAGGASAGAPEVAAIAAGAQAVVSEFPPGDGKKLASQLIQVASVAAESVAAIETGATVGAIAGLFIPIPGIGPVVGAVIGAVIAETVVFVENVLPFLEQDHFAELWDPLAPIQDLINEFQQPPQPDYRYLSEKICFPGAADGKPGPKHSALWDQPNISLASSPYIVVPGELDWNARLEPSTLFYQTFVPPNNVPGSRSYVFGVTWPKIHGSTVASRNQAWLLAGFVLQEFAKKLGHTAPSAVIPRSEFVGMMGGELRASKALAKFLSWYGPPDSFSTTIPFASTQGHPQGAFLDISPMGIGSRIDEFEAHPLDYLYYPIPVRYDSGAKLFFPTNLSQETDVFCTPDTTALWVAEMAALDMPTEAVFHFAVQQQRLFVESRKKDAAKLPGLSTDPHRNFARVIGRTSKLLKVKYRKLPKSKRTVVAGSAPADRQPLHRDSHATTSAGGAAIAVGGTAAALYLLSRFL
jgi:hypothetical protein